MNFSEELEIILRGSGGYPGRVCLDWEPAEGYTLFPEAQAILNEFSGLYICSEGPGIVHSKSSIDFRKDVDYPPSIFENYPDLGLYPLGETFSGIASFLTATNGKFYVHDNVGVKRLSLLATSFERSLEIVLLGDEWSLVTIWASDWRGSIELFCKVAQYSV